MVEIRSLDQHDMFYLPVSGERREGGRDEGGVGRWGRGGRWRGGDRKRQSSDRARKAGWLIGRTMCRSLAACGKVRSLESIMPPELTGAGGLRASSI